MESDRHQEPGEALLGHAQWLRRLAHELAGDAHRAEDLAQETWVKALSRPPHSEPTARSWLATVMRNVLRTDVQRGNRRRDREHRAAEDSGRDAVLEDAPRLLDRAQGQRDLAEAVLSLEEPYRTTVLLRYFDGLGPRAIATRSGVPLATVKTRLRRGLARLRSILEREHGGEPRGWLHALQPILLSPTPAAATPILSFSASLGALAMHAKVALVLLVIVSLGAGWFFTRGVDPVRSADPSLATEGLGSGESDPDAVLEQVEGGEPRARVAAEMSTAPDPDPVALPQVAPASLLRVRGRVIDPNGVGLEGLELVSYRMGRSALGAGIDEPLAGEVSLGSSGDGGRFELELESPTWLGVSGREHVTLLAARSIADETDREAIIVAARSIEVSGWVQSVEGGSPVEGASLSLELPSAFRASLGFVLDESAEVPFRVQSDAAGAFRWGSFPAVSGARLRVQHPDYLELDVEAPFQEHTAWVLALEPPADEIATLEGVVIDAAGSPVPSALVGWGLDSRVTAADGSFSFPMQDPDSFTARMGDFLAPDTSRLHAVKEGYLPAEVVTEERDEDGRPRWGAGRVVLQLGRESFSIEGRVLNPSGDPVEGVQVWVADPTMVVGVGTPGRDRFPNLTSLESAMDGGTGGFRPTTTDEGGRFRIQGLLDRDYRLAAMDPSTLLRIVRDGVAAGREDVVLRIDPGETFGILKGTVVDGLGNPLPGVEVFPMCDVFRITYQGNTVGTQHETVEGDRTNDEGEFVLHDVPKDLVYLRLEHPDAIPVEWGRHIQGGLGRMIGEDADAIRIPMPRRMHFVIELDDPSEADGISVLDLEGATLEVSEFMGRGRREHRRVPLTGGRSSQLAAPETAATLVLFRGEEEVRRAPLHLTPGAVTTVRP